MAKQFILLVHNIITEFRDLFRLIKAVSGYELLSSYIYVRACIYNDVDFVIHFLVGDAGMIGMHDFRMYLSPLI